MSQPITLDQPLLRLGSPSLNSGVKRRARPVPKAPTNFAGQQFSFHRQMSDDVAAEGLRRARQLGSTLAVVCSLKGADHLAVRAAYPRNPGLTEAHYEVMARVLKDRTLFRGVESTFKLCVPLQDRNGEICGLLYAERTKGCPTENEIDQVLDWAMRPESGMVINLRNQRLSKRPAQETMAHMLSSLAVMIEAGVPLYRSLKHLSRHAEDVQAAQLCEALARDIERGRQLSRAAAKFPKFFSPMHIGMLQVAEQTGGLERALRQMATFEEKRLTTQRKVRSALTYPAGLLVFCILGLIIAPPFLLEGHFQLMRDLKVNPPLITKFLMAFSSSMRTPWPYLILGGLGLFAWRKLQSTLADPTKLMRLTGFVLKIPRLGSLVRNVLTARFARALATQLEAGVMPTQALETSGLATGNPLMVRVARQACHSVFSGRGLALSLKRTGFFSPLFIAIMASGEQVGEVAKMAGWLANMGDEELDHAIELVVAMIEPLIMLAMGIVVGVMVLGTLLPLSQALEAL